MCPVVTVAENSAQPAEPEPRRPVPRSGPVWIALFVGLVACTNIAAASFAGLLADHPLRLLGLSSRNRYLILARPEVDGPWLWGLVATVRLLAAAAVCHAIGRCYGDRALRWFWRFLGMPAEQVARFEQQVDRAEWIVVPWFVGSNIVWALTGAARSPWRRLLPLALVGIVVRLALLWWLSGLFEDELRSVVDWLTGNQTWIILVSVGLVVLANLRNFRRGR